MLSNKKAIKLHILISSGEDTHDLCSLSSKKRHLMEHTTAVHQEGQTGLKREKERLICASIHLKNQ